MPTPYLDKKARKAYDKKELDTTEVSFLDNPTSSAQYAIGERARNRNMSQNMNHSEYPNRDYKYSNKLGDGSASKLYKGIVVRPKDNGNLKEGDPVIIKRINKIEEWRSELNILKELKDSSSKLLNLVDFYESDRFAYIVTSFYEGFDLFEHIDINVPYSEKYTKKLVREMAICIKSCHDKGIAHLDIKCENYMVLDMTTPKLILIDFGHAEKIKPNIMKEGGNYGTCFYVCPEGYRKFYSMKSDTWSLGICTHLLLTGDYPYVGDDDNEYARNVCKGNVNISNKISNSAKDFLYKCLDYNPKTRPGIDEVLTHPFLRQ